MKALLLVFAAVAGALNAVQAGCSSTLGKAIGPMPAAVAIGVVAVVTYLAAGAVSGQLAWPGPERIAAAPWWAWMGGVLGAVFVLSQLFVAQKVGSGLFIALTVTSSVMASLLIDNYGLVGFDVHPAGWGRIAGAMFMFAGLGLIARY